MDYTKFFQNFPKWSRKNSSCIPKCVENSWFHYSKRRLFQMRNLKILNLLEKIEKKVERFQILG